MVALVLTTGGTIGSLAYPDPVHPPKSATFRDGRDYVHILLAQPPFNRFPIHCLSLEQRDSKGVDALYRERLLNTIYRWTERKVIVTHGTNTLLETAAFLHGKQVPKSIILTGAMIPLANGEISDGYKNLDFALEWIQLRREAGVYIVLCDYDAAGNWQPRLYEFEPGRYEKFYDADGRYHRLREIPK